jgi:phage terminase small subunit
MMIEMTDAPLTPRQRRFVEEYLIDLNATEAARRAGYSTKTAGQIGHENLKKPEIAAAVAAGLETKAEAADLTARWVLDQLRREAQLAGPGASHAARVQALKLLGLHLRLFPTRQEISGPDGSPIRYDDADAVNWSHLTDEEMEQAIELHRRAADRTSASPGGRGFLQQHFNGLTDIFPQHARQISLPFTGLLDGGQQAGQPFLDGGQRRRRNQLPQPVQFFGAVPGVEPAVALPFGPRLEIKARVDEPELPAVS